MVGRRQKKMLLTGGSVLVCLTLVFALMLHSADPELIRTLSGLSAWDYLFPLGAAALYQTLEALICWIIVRTRLPHFLLIRAFRVMLLKVFGDVASFGAASLPMQAYLLHRSGLPVGAGVGLMTLEYVFHKFSILLYATGMLLLQHRWLMEDRPELMNYLFPAYGISALIITVLVLACTWGKVHCAALWCVGRLPDRGKWVDRKKNLRTQLEALYSESHILFQNRRCCLAVLLLNAVKLFVLFSIPYGCMGALGISCPSFFQMQLLSSLMLLLTSVLPNLAGTGPTEFAFLMIFTPCVGRANAVLALVLYRVATYYAPFLASTVSFCTISR